MDINELEKSIIEITLLSAENRKENVRWLAKQNSLMLYEIFKLKKNYFHKLKAGGVITDLILIELIAFLLSLKELLESTKLPTNKNRSNDLTRLKKIARNQAKQFKKARKTPKRDKLLFMQNNIIVWIEEGLTDRSISKIISSKMKFDISHTEISRFHRELKENGHVEK